MMQWRNKEVPHISVLLKADGMFMFFKRKISEENLKKGELLFFKHNGDFAQMIQMGDYLTYKKLNISQEKRR